MKVQPLGGVQRCLELAEQAGLPVVVSSALESSVGLGAGLALAAALPELRHACGLVTATLLTGDLVAPPLHADGGMLPVGRSEPSPELLERHAAGAEIAARWEQRLADCTAQLWDAATRGPPPLRPHYADGVHERTAPTLPPASVPAPRPTGSGAVDQSVALWSALAGLGMREAVLAPGSRSAPLVYALASAAAGERIRPHVPLDARAAAFTALGISRHDPAHPAAVVTTSGTATAHLHAAVMEAHHARIPLLVLTADRPAELREVGANQTTRQAGMFRSLVRLAVDLPAPTADEATALELRTIVSTAARALAAATGEHPGPVHLNLSFRDPLVPGPRTDDPAPLAETPAQRIVLTRRAGTGPAAPHPVPVDDRTVVVAGDGAGPEAAELAARHGLPLLAEPSSGARHGQTLVPGYPALLREVMADAAHPLRPQRAIVLGHPTLSRPVVGALLGAEDVEVIVVDP